MTVIFLDESGQFKKQDHEHYFVIGSFTVGNQRRTEKQFRSWQASRFPRKMRHQAEIKFSEIKITEALRLKTLKHISELDVRIHFAFLRRENIPDSFRKGPKIKEGELYTHIIGELLEGYLPINDHEFRVFCDQRHLKGISFVLFRKILETHMMPLLPAKTVIQIEMLDSTTNSNIQIADWISGALAWYLEGKPLGDECYQMLKNNIIGEGLELFRQYWGDNKKLNRIG